MDEASRLSALQKAYAEIITNVSKEAACRVMASEKKRLRIQQELSDVKDEGLCMLLRLKQMLDSKSNEAESTSIVQRRRIDELEARLDEAKGVEKELRGELKDVLADLARVRSWRCNSSRTNHTGPGTASTDLIESNELKASKSCPSNAHSYAHSADFSLRAMKPIGSGLHPYSFSRKIQALEPKSNDQLSLPIKDSHLQNEVQGRGEKGDAFFRITNVSPDQPYRMEKDPDELQVTKTKETNLHLEVPKSFQRKRKRTTRHGKGKIPMHPPELRQASRTSSQESSIASDAEQMGIRFPANHSYMSLVRPCSVRDRKDNSKLSIEAAVVRQEKRPVRTLTSPPGKSDIRSINDLPSCVEVSNLADPPRMGDRYDGKFLKYTFQRRRKKRNNFTLPDGIPMAEQVTPKTKIDDEHNNSPESNVLDLMNESSEDMQLMEVAKQLITLSGRK